MPLALAILPSTSWAVRNHLRIVGANLNPSAQLAGGIDDGLEELAFPPIPDGRDPAQHLAHLLCADRPEHLNQLRNWARQDPPNGRICATYLEHKLDHSPPPSRTVRARDKPDDIAARAKSAMDAVQRFSGTWIDLIEIAKRGALAEPDNLLFPLLQARLESALGRKEDCAKSLAKAAKCRAIRDYQTENDDLLKQEWRARFGYRGAVAWDASASFPDFLYLIAVRSFGYEVRQMNSRQAVLDFIQCGRTIYSRAKTVQQERAAGYLLVNALPEIEGAPPPDEESRRQHSINRAAAFLPGSDLPQLVAEAELAPHWPRVMSDRRWDAERQSLLGRLASPENAVFSPYSAAAPLYALIGTLLLAVAFLIVGSIRWSGPPAASLPALVAAFVAIFDGFATKGWSGSALLLPLGLGYLLLAVGACFERLRTWCFIVGFFLPFASMSLHLDDLTFNGGPFEAIPFGFFGVLLLRYLWRKRKGEPATNLFMPLLIMTFAGFLLGAPKMGYGNLEYPSVLAGIVATSLLVAAGWQSTTIPLAARQLARTAPVVIALASLTYGILVCFDVTCNSSREAMLREQRHEVADGIAWAHEHWREPIPK